MSDEDQARAANLARQAAENVESQIRLSHRSWDATQTNINTMIGQVAALSNAKLVDFFMNNAATKNNVPMTGEPIEETLRGLIADRGDTANEVVVPVPTPSLTPPMPGKSSWLGPAVLAAVLGAGGLGAGLTIPHLFNQDASQSVGTEQENYRYNYLQARGAHLPPENGDDG